MLIILSIIGFIVGLYVVVLVRGHLATKKVLTSLERIGPQPDARDDGNHKHHVDDDSG
jgi:hypothetical protein